MATTSSNSTSTNDAPVELTYFDGAGRAELTRLVLAAGGVEFTDNRVAMADWPAMKSDPNSAASRCFGSMPVIEHGNALVAQSTATATYAAELGIYAQGRLGDDPHARATEAMALGAHADLQSAMYKCLFGSDESKAAGREGLQAAADKILSGYERMLDRKAVDGPFFVSTDGPTIADLAVYDNITSPFPGLNALGITDISAYPKVMAVVAAVAEDSRIKAYKGASTSAP